MTTSTLRFRVFNDSVRRVLQRRQSLLSGLLLLMAVLSFSTAQAQTYTATFSTQPTIDKYGYAADWPWNSTVTVNLGGVDYLVTDAINGSFTWNGSAIYYETAGDVNLHIKRKDGQAFKFYGVSLKYTNYKIAPYYVYPFLTLQYATTGSTQADEPYDADKTLTVSKPAGVAVTGSGVTLKFSGLATLTLDDLIVGPAAATVAPTVETAAASSVMATNAVLGGNVTADGGNAVTTRGVVYSASNTSPIVNGTNVTNSVNGSGTGTFSQTISGLSPSTTYYVRAYATNGVGTSYGAVQLFTTAASLSVGAVTPNPVCAGSTVSVTYTSSAVGNPISVYLNGPGTTNLLLAALGSSNASGTISVTIPADRVSGTYTVSISGSGVSSASSGFSVNAKPAAPTTTNISYCQNASATQLTASGQNLKWYTTSSGGTGFTSITPSTATLGSTTYYVSQTVNGCESDRAPLTVTINTTPLAPSVANTSVVYCQNTTAAALQATATVGNTLNWYNSQGSALGSTAPTPQTTNPGTTFYQVSQRSASGCEGPRVQITVTINAAPAAPATSPVNVCQGSAPVSLVNGVTTTGTLKWYTSPTSASLAAAPQVATSTTGSQVFYVSQTNANGCESSRAAITYTVNALPNPPSVVSPVTYCQNAVAQPLQATPSPGGTLNFYTVASGGTSTTALTPQTQSSNIYYVSQTINGCESGSRAPITVTINATPPRPGVSTPVGYCQFATAAPLSATASTSNTLNWYGTNTTGGVASTQVPTPPTTTLGSTTYYVSQTDGTGCEGPRAEITVLVNPVPAPPTTTPVAVCQNTTPVSLATSVTAAGSLRWYTTPVGGTGSAIAPVPPTSAVGQTTYYVSQLTSTGCESSRTALTVTINALPLATLRNNGPLSCAQLTVTLTAGGGGTYRFSPGTTQIGSGNTATVSLGGVYSVIATDGNGCSATAETTVGSDQNNPQASLTNDGPLTCAKTTVTLTAGGTGSYRFSSGATQTGTSNTATVTTNGIYSVTVTSANGCSATAQTTVDVNTIVAAPTLTASALSTENAPISVMASGCSGTLNWTATGGSGIASEGQYTVNQVGNYTLTATCTVGSCTSPAAPALALQIRPGDFAITAVSTQQCQLVDASRGEYRVMFTPQYSGLNSNPVSLAVLNEVDATTVPGPYTIRLYTDNPVVILVAMQAGSPETRFRYNWLAACSGSVSPNRPPVTTGITTQQLSQMQPYQLGLTSYFSDPDGQPLTFSIIGLPAGLALSGNQISGTPTVVGSSQVIITATDPSGLQVSTSVVFTVSVPATPPTAGFAIVGITDLTCVNVSSSERRVSFSPVYSGLDGQPVRFRVINEIDATTAPGPYTIRLYTDNPTITLEAVQAGVTTTYRYNWLAACASQPGTPPVATNRAPVVSLPLADQTATAGQGYSLFIASNTFSDPDGDALRLSVSGLPAGLIFSASLNAVTGTPAQAGVTTIQVTATDARGLSVSTSFVLTVVSGSPTTREFAITGVTTVRCEAVTASERRVTFTPTYAGTSGAAISLRVINEIDATTAPGPYSIRLYTDNPVVTLEAIQEGRLVTYRYEWLKVCNTNARQGGTEISSALQVRVLGNPVTSESAEVEINGVEGQPVQVQLVDLLGYPIHQHQIRQAASVERLSLPIGNRQGVLLLRVNTATQQQQIKLLVHSN